MKKPGYMFKVWEVATHLPKPDGKGRPGNAIRAWARRGLIDAYHHGPNAEWHLSVRGVKEAWRLWAIHKHLDPGDMPQPLRELIASQEAAGQSSDEPLLRIVITVHGNGNVEVQSDAA